MRPKGSARELEIIRQRALTALENGSTQVEVARVLGTGPSTISRWWTRSRRDPNLILAKPHPGKPPRLSQADLETLTQALVEGPERFGWKIKVWTCPRVAEVILKLFGVTFHVDHVFKILTRKLGWSSQKPEKMARERREGEVSAWRKQEYPAIKKKCQTEEGHDRLPR
jgi:transposase